MHRRLPWALALLLLLAAPRPASATPEFGRRWGATSCNTCHTVVPKLNARGLDFWARGYRPDPDLNMEERATVPLSLWLTQNYDDHISEGNTNLYPGKAELISGGTIGDRASYFVEWRLLSLEAQSNGSLRDRSGRFEDLWISVNPDEEQRWTLTAGQFRPLYQVDPGRKISVGTPALYDTSLAGDKAKDPRITSLRAFSTSGRSPSLAVAYQSIQGEQAMDGLFHAVTVPFPGEFSIPLNKAARTNASFEFEGTPKGVVLETYYRQGLSSIGAHSFVDGDRLLLVGVGELNVGDFYATAGLGFDNRKNQPTRTRGSVEIEYLPTFEDNTWRPGIGFRVEDVSNDGRPVAYIPYFAVSIPNDQGWTSLLQLEYKGQAGHERLRLDLSIIF